MRLESIKRIAVLGAGTMGPGIAQRYAMSGRSVNLYDISEQALEKAKVMLRTNLDTFVEEELLTAEEADGVFARVSFTADLETALKDVQYVQETVAEKPAKAPQIRKFMDYYLPTTLKMLASYRTMSNRGVSVNDMTEARSTVIRGMGMVLTACQKQLDNLYKDDILDVSTDIDVLEQMLKRDGFTEGELGQLQQSATAAAAQMQKTNPPQLDVPKQDDFVSFYDRNNQHTNG